jgi:hypothetical protein
VIEDTIRKIEDSLKGGHLSAERERELRRLLAELRAELKLLEATRGGEARRIATLTGAAHAAPAGERRDAANRLAESVREFEATHPKLTSLVDAIAETLASAGI